jgi:hypothetical protein
MYCTNPVKHRARRQHICTWCGQRISPGEEYWTWASYDAGDCFSNKMHQECRAACDEECRERRDNEYMAYSNERPAEV